MIYLIDPKELNSARCKKLCGLYFTCPLDVQHPLYGIPT
jgi:hypothetical protein